MSADISTSNIELARYCLLGENLPQDEPLGSQEDESGFSRCTLSASRFAQDAL